MSQSGESTPGFDIPGAFPLSGESAVQSSGQGDGDTVIDTARQYLPRNVINTMEMYMGFSGISTAKSPTNGIPLKGQSQENLAAKPENRIGVVGSLPGSSLLPREATLSGDNHTADGYTTADKESLSQLPHSTARVHDIVNGDDVGEVKEIDQSLSPDNLNGGHPKDEKAFSSGTSSGSTNETPFKKSSSQTNEVKDDDSDSAQNHVISRTKDVADQVRPVDYDTKSLHTTGLPDNSKAPPDPSPGTLEHLETESDGVTPSSDAKDAFRLVDPVPDQKSMMPREDRQGSLSTTKPKNVEASRIVDNSGLPLPSNTQKALPPSLDSTPMKSTAAGRDQMQSHHGEDHHSAQLHPMNGNCSHDEAEIATDEKSTLPDPRPKSLPSSVSSGGSPKKVGIKDKISGGAKVFMGTVGRNHNKVEAGKKILHGGI